MKWIIFGIFLTFGLVLTYAEELSSTAELEWDKKSYEDLDQCMNDHKQDPEQFKTAVDNLERAAMCVIACALKKDGGMKEDSSFDKDKMKQLRTKFMNKEEKFEKVLEKCLDAMDGKEKELKDECEMILEFTKCTRKTE